MKEIIELFEELHESFANSYYDTKEYKRYFKDMTEGEYKYINIIYQNPNIKPSEFSKTAKISKPAATKIIQKFIRRNYIQKKEDPEDRRAFNIILNNDLRENINMSQKKYEETIYKKMRALSDEEVIVFKDLLHKINKGDRNT